MTRLPPRTNFHSSALLRCLADLAVMDAAEPENAFAEKLGLWIHFTDAITLSAVHGDDAASRWNAAHALPAGADFAVGTEFGRVQAALANSIIKCFSPGQTQGLVGLPAPDPDLPADLAAAYKPYRRFYETHQRNMESRIRPLKISVRETVARASPRLRKLAELDGTLEKILRDRESRLLMSVPVLLEKRFRHLFKSHQQKLADARQADNPQLWTQANGWLTHFCSDMQMVLLAELELRLQPTVGLIEALQQDKQ